MNSNTLLDIAEIYQNISESSQNFIAEGFDDETPEQRRRRTANPQTPAQRAAQHRERRAKEGIGETGRREGDVRSGTRGDDAALEAAQAARAAAAEAETERQRRASAEVTARRKAEEERRAKGLPPVPKPKPKVVRLQSQTETEPDAPTEHDIATGRRLGRRGTTTPQEKPEDESTLAARRRKAALKMLAKLQGKEDDSQNESYVAESRRRKKKSKKPARWWDDDGDGIGWEPGEVSGHFKRKPRVAKEEYSNWREDLTEISSILENQKKKMIEK